MAYVLTAVAASDPLSAGHLAEIEHILSEFGIATSEDPAWLARHKAADIGLVSHPTKEQWATLKAAMAPAKIDLFISPQAGRRKKLLLADMDSTIVEGETLDELAAYAGLQEKIAAITVLAMRGELDFENALFERVALLEGLSEEALEQTLAQTVLTKGAVSLVQTMAHHGARCVLVSGGFTFFTESVATRAGFHHHHGNILVIDGGRLSGQVEKPVLDKTTKEKLLSQYCTDLKLTASEALAIGDGANDLPMLLKAGLGIGFRPKPLLVEHLDNVILYGDLTAALYAQGYREEEIITG